MTYTWEKHLSNFLIGIYAGLIAGLFFTIYNIFKDRKFILILIMEIIGITIAYLILTPLSYWAIKKMLKEPIKIKWIIKKMFKK